MSGNFVEDDWCQSPLVTITIAYAYEFVVSKMHKIHIDRILSIYFTTF